MTLRHEKIFFKYSVTIEEFKEFSYSNSVSIASSKSFFLTFHKVVWFVLYILQIVGFLWYLNPTQSLSVWQKIMNYRSCKHTIKFFKFRWLVTHPYILIGLEHYRQCQWSTFIAESFTISYFKYRKLARHN